MTKNYWKQLYLTKKAEAIKLLGGKCVDCGNTEKLEFDHIDPTKKLFSITPRIRQNVKEELEKCELRCSFCHKAKTATRHGKRRMYNNGCRCALCTKANRIYMKQYYLVR